jgi:diacylglycerol kinase
MLGELQRRVRSFGYAFAGLGYLFRTQPNAWIHALATTAVVALAGWLRLPAGDWALLVLAMMAVWMGELFNTAVEAVVDLVMPEQHPLARAAKDVAAGAVLVAALGAVAIGLLILGPPLWARIS